MLITSSQMQWTSDCEKALGRGDKKGLKSLKKKQVLFVNIYVINLKPLCDILSFFRMPCWINSQS